MRETRLSGSEGGGAEPNRLLLPLYRPSRQELRLCERLSNPASGVRRKRPESTGSPQTGNPWLLYQRRRSPSITRHWVWRFVLLSRRTMLSPDESHYGLVEYRRVCEPSASLRVRWTVCTRNLVASRNPTAKIARAGRRRPARPTRTPYCFRRAENAAAVWA